MSRDESWRSKVISSICEDIRHFTRIMRNQQANTGVKTTEIFIKQLVDICVTVNVFLPLTQQVQCPTGPLWVLYGWKFLSAHGLTLALLLQSHHWTCLPRSPDTFQQSWEMTELACTMPPPLLYGPLNKNTENTKGKSTKIKKQLLKPKLICETNP